MISIRYMYVLVHAERHMYCMYVPVSVHIISCRSSFSSTKPNDNNSYSMYLLILRDRTDGRSAGNLHVSKACNCLVSQTKHTNRHEALLIGSIGYDFTSNVLTMYPNHVSTTPQLHTSRRMIAVITFVRIVAIQTSSDESKFVMPQLYHAFVKPWDSTKVVISCIYADRS